MITTIDPKSESSTRVLRGAPGRLAVALAVGLSAYALYWVIGIVQPQIYRITFLLAVLLLTFLLYPVSQGSRTRVTALDWMLLGASVVALAWPIVAFEQFVYRAATPNGIDVGLGTLTIILVLEATRRTVGWILPVTALVFLAYGYLGPLLSFVGLSLIAHRGYPLDRLVGTLYMTLEGIFGVPLDVASTYIVLFTIYGAILHYSGAGQFFINWAMAAMGRSSGGPGRTVVLSGFLLGTVSGSGVATTVTLGAVAWPLLRRAGYPPEAGAGILSASGIGAIMAPPTLGAAAFLIAEFLKISYLQVIMMASVPALLYYFSILLMIEADSRRMGIRAVDADLPTLGTITYQSGYHFVSLIVIVVLLVNGMTPFRAVFSAMAVAVVLSFLKAEYALKPARFIAALESGGRGVLAVAATTATAGIIVGIVTLTGLGLKIAGIIVALANGSVFFTVVYAALAVWILGLAVPVTASYIIAAVMVAPALTLVGVPEVAAHMFIFYYAVLSEVSPPTALSPFAAAAITGGNPFRTMMLTWKYTLPAFLVPFTFTLNPEGLGILLQAPWPDVVRTTLTTMTGIAALAMGLGGWLFAETNRAERVFATSGGLLLFYPSPATDITGATVVALAVAMHLSRFQRRTTT